MTLNDLTGRLMRWRLRLLEFEYEVVYRPGRVHQVPDALSRLKRGEDDGSDIDDELPTSPVGKEATVKDILHVVHAVTRRQNRQSNAAKRRSEAKRKAKKRDHTDGAGFQTPATPEGEGIGAAQIGAAPRSSEPDGREPEPKASPLPVVKPFIRPKRVSPVDAERTRRDTNFLPLPDEDDDDDDDERDLILDAHNILAAAPMEREGDDGEVMHDHSDLQDLPTPIERDEILVEQTRD